MRRLISCGLLAALAGCGGGDAASIDAADARADGPVDAPDAAPDARTPLDDVEPADCGGDALVARGGDVALVVSALAIPAAAEAVDLDGDGTPDNKLAGLAALVRAPIEDGLADGSITIPIELFDRGPDPDGCLKLALYRGACAGAACSYTDATPDLVSLAPASIGPGGAPVSRLRAMRTGAGGHVDTGVGFVVIDLPIMADGSALSLPLTVLSGEGTLTGAGLHDLALYGVLQAGPLDATPSPDLPQIGTTSADSLLDAIFANVLGPLLALPTVGGHPGCRAADIDVDGDGLESFCDDDADGDTDRISLCIDGDGTLVHDGDGGVARCTDALVGGVPRFRDGISAAFVLSAIPTTIAP